jgi:hypothetical protein
VRRLLPLLAVLAAVVTVSAPAVGRDKPLAVGDRAPEFALRDQDGKAVTLSAVRARRDAVVVAFYIQADSPG